MFITDEDECCFRRDNIKLYYENDYRLVNVDGKYVYTSMSEDVDNSTNVINIDEIFDFLSKLNSRLIYNKINHEYVYKHNDEFFPSTGVVGFDFRSNAYEPFEMPRGYIYMSIYNIIDGYDRILVNYLDSEEIELVMDRYPEVFKSRYILNLKFVD